MSTRRVISERMVIEVDGTRVEGDVERTVRSVDVRIVSPYTGLSGGRYRAAFLHIFGDELAGPRGELVAIEILEHLYRVGKHLYENLDMLRQKLAEMDSAIEHLDRERFPTEDDFRAVRRGLRAQLRSGAMDSKTYQKRLMEEKERLKARKESVWQMEAAFFASNFAGLFVNQETEIFAILRSQA